MVVQADAQKAVSSTISTLVVGAVVMVLNPISMAKMPGDKATLCRAGTQIVAISLCLLLLDLKFGVAYQLRPLGHLCFEEGLELQRCQGCGFRCHLMQPRLDVGQGQRVVQRLV